jgi:hypothetical protein
MTEIIRASLTVDGDSTGVISAKVQTNQYNVAGELRATVPDDRTASIGSTASLEVNGTLVFTGTVEDVETKGVRQLEITARDAATELKNESVTQVYREPTAEQVIRDVADKAGVTIGEIDVPPEELLLRCSERPAANVIQDVTRLADAIWYIDEANELVVTTSPEPAEHTLEKLKPETSAGLYAAPYTRVRVYASTPISSTSPARTGGVGARPLLPSEPIQATVGDDDGATYTARPASVQTYQQAENYARKLLTEFQSQRGQGEIISLGREEIRPFDVIQLPPLGDSPEYIVAELEHSISNSEGFLTRIKPGRVV